jgi:hypothetical protein
VEGTKETEEEFKDKRDNAGGAGRRKKTLA